MTKLRSQPDAKPVAPARIGEIEERATAWRRLPIATRLERNLEHIRSRVIDFETLATSRVATQNPLPANIFFHVPKCGGTTIEHVYAKNVSPNGMLHANAPSLGHVPQALGMKKKFPRILMGHLRLDHLLYQLDDRPLVHFTMLRDPIGRTVSYFNYLRTSGRHPKHEAATNMTLEEFVSTNQLVEVSNGQTLRLAGELYLGSKDTPHIDEILSSGRGDEVLARAKDNLVRCFSFFGLVERFTDFWITAHRLLGWRELYEERKNKSEVVIHRSDVPDHVIATIRERNALDRQLFEFARDLHDERSARIGIDEAARERLAEGQRQWDALVAREI